MSRDVSAHASFLRQKSFGSLDGIRCASICAVVFHHGSGGLELGLLTGRGFLGVDMFFVLSGFLIVTLLLRETGREGTISLRAFYARRTLRIMPLYYGVVLLYALLFGVLRPDGENGRALGHDLPFLLTYTANWVAMQGMLAVAWSLAAEEQFYLVWPPIQKWVPKPLSALLSLIAVSVGISLGLLDPLLDRWFGWGPRDPTMLRESTFTPILLGVLLAYLLHAPRTFRIFERYLARPELSAVWSVLLIACFVVLPADLRGGPRLLIHLLMTLFLSSCVVHEEHALTKLMKLKPVVRIGVLSYGFYLWHMFVLDGVDRLITRGMPAALEFPALMLGTWLVAELSFRYFEQPFLRLKRRFSR